MHIENLGEEALIRCDAEVFFLGGEDQAFGTVFGAAEVFYVGVVKVHFCVAAGF